MATTTMELHSREAIIISGEEGESSLPRVIIPQDAQPAMLPVSRQRQTRILLCAFFDVFVTIGLNQAYGVFLSYYLADGSSDKDPFLPKREVKSKATLAFVGTLAAGMTWGGSIFVNPLMARTRDPRPLTVAGAALIGLGYVLASFCHRVPHLVTDRPHLTDCCSGLAAPADSRPYLWRRNLAVVLPCGRRCARVF